MNINPLSLVKLNNNYNAPNKAIYFEPQTDTFVKSSNSVAFKGAEKTADAKSFVQWAQETDFIQTQLEEILTNPDNLIGSGFSSSAFRIPNNEDYILRVGTDSLKNSLHKPNIPKATLKDTDAHHDINVGQQVAEISVPSKYSIDYEKDGFSTIIEVLKKQNGESIGVQPPETLVTGEYNSTTKEGVAPYEDISRKETYSRTIHKVAQLPVEAYEKLLTEFTKACEIGYGFDHLNSNNLLVDSEGEAINLIDMSSPYSGPSKPNYANLLYSLTNISYYKTFNNSYPNPMSPELKQQSFDDTVQIIDKFMNAMKNLGIKFDKDNASSEFCYVFLFSMPCMMYSRSASYDGFWKKAEMMGVA